MESAEDVKMEPTEAEEYNELLGCKWNVPDEVMKQTPSVKRGMSMADEMEARRRGIRFIKYMMRYLTFEKVIQGNTLELTKTPRVFPTAVHVFHRFYTVHPLQFFNEYVTAVACVFHAAKIEEHILSVNRILELARVNASSLPWVKIPDELSFDKSDWAELWKNEVVETEFLVFTTVNPFRFLFTNVYGFIIQFLRKFVGVSLREDEAVKIRDKAFMIASDVYSTGCQLVVTESTKMVATMCIMMVLKNKNIADWKGKTESQQYWYHLVDKSLTMEKLKSMERDFLAQLKQYNSAKTKTDDKSKVKGVSPSSDYGSESSVTSNPVSPSDSMCSDRDISNEPTSPAVSTASSSDHGLAYDGRDHMKRPIKQIKSEFAPPCQLSLSVRKDVPTPSSAALFRQRRKLEIPSLSSIEPVQKKMKLHSPVRYP